MSIPVTLRARTGQRNRRGAVSAAEVQSRSGGVIAEGLNDRFSGLPHEGGNFGEVAFFPQCFIRILTAPVGPDSFPWF